MYTLAGLVWFKCVHCCQYFWWMSGCVHIRVGLFNIQHKNNEIDYTIIVLFSCSRPVALCDQKKKHGKTKQGPKIAPNHCFWCKFPNLSGFISAVLGFIRHFLNQEISWQKDDHCHLWRADKRNHGTSRNTICDKTKYSRLENFEPALAFMRILTFSITVLA